MICASIERMHFVSRHPHKFEVMTMPIIVNLLKFGSEITIEFAAMVIVTTWKTPKDVLLSHLAIISITSLDQIYFKHVQSDLKEKLLDNDFKLQIEPNKDRI